LKTMFSKNKSIVPKQSGAVANSALATADLAKLGQTARDKVAKEDLPRASIRILQKGSPQVDKKHGKYVEGAEPGMIFNTSTRELYDGAQDKEQLVILICKYWPKYIEWLPGRKGFVGEHEIGSDAVLPQNLETVIEDGKTLIYSRLTGNIMSKTAIYHCLAFMSGADEPIEVVLDMTSTNWTTAKLINSHFQNAKVPDGQGNLVPAPTFTWAYQLFHEYRENDKAQSWYVWNFKPLMKITEMSENAVKYVHQALAYRNLVEEGSVDFDYRSEQE